MGRLSVASGTALTTKSAASRLWVEVGKKKVCDTGKGEKYRGNSSGKRSSVDERKKSCQDTAGCQSISFFQSGWCSHFSTPCTKTKKNKKVMVIWRLSTSPRHLRGF